MTKFSVLRAHLGHLLTLLGWLFSRFVPLPVSRTLISTPSGALQPFVKGQVDVRLQSIGGPHPLILNGSIPP